MKAELILRAPDRQDTFHLTSERVTVGRGINANIRVNDQLISREHCEVLHMGERWVVRDLGSSNGTRVNGQPVKDKVLEWGDKIEVGETTLLFVSEQRPARDSDDLDMTPSRREDTKTKILKGSEVDVKSASQERYAGEYMNILYEMDLLALEKENIPHFSRCFLRQVLRGRRFGRAAVVIFDEAGGVTDRHTRVEKEHAKWKIHIEPEHLRNVFAGDSIQARHDRIDDKEFNFVLVPIRGRSITYGALYVDDLIALEGLAEAEVPLLTAVGRVMGLRIDDMLDRQRLRLDRPTRLRKRPGPDSEIPPQGTNEPDQKTRL